MPRPTAALLLLAALGCTGPRALDTRIHGRAAETLQAEAVRSDGMWQVSLPLPAGTWTISAPQERQPVQVLDREGRGEARWVVAPARWRDGAPLHLRLRDPQGTELALEVRYGAYPTAGRVALAVLHTLVSGQGPR